MLKQLLSSKTIAMEDAPFLWQDPAPLPPSFTFDRVEGMLLGLAAGDALGNTSESMNPADRAQAHGQIADYLPNRYAGWRPVGLPSDDTQMAFWLVEVLLEDGHLNPDHLARRFTREPIFGIGRTVRQFLENYKGQNLPWQQAGAASAGNGALMRIAPVVLPHLRRPTCDLWSDAAVAGMVTHNDRASNAACVAFTALLWDLLHMQKPPDARWWPERFVQVTAPLEGSKTAYSTRMLGLEYTGPVWKFAVEQVSRAIDRKWTTREACDTWGSGAFLLETIPCALYILARYANDPEQAIIRAVNDTRDNDTAAAIVGAAVGALHGASALPRRWIDGLLGRTNASDDGHIFELIKKARTHFWEKA